MPHACRPYGQEVTTAQRFFYAAPRSTSRASSRTNARTMTEDSTATTMQKTPMAQKPSVSTNTPPMVAPATVASDAVAEEKAKSVPRAAGTCSMRSDVFVANRAPITADNATFNAAAASSGGEAFGGSRRIQPDPTIVQATTRRGPMRTPTG